MNKAVSEYLARNGRKGGLSRAKRLTPEQMREANRRAVLARWAKKRTK